MPEISPSASGAPRLLVGPVTVTEDPGDLPMAVLITPHNQEIGDPLALATRELAEAVRSLRNGTKILDGKNPESARNELTAKLATHIFRCVGEHLLPRPGDATHIVIELDVRREITGVLLQLLCRAAMVESVKYSGIKR